jgi:hypothetical protein
MKKRNSSISEDELEKELLSGIRDLDWEWWGCVEEGLGGLCEVRSMFSGVMAKCNGKMDLCFLPLWLCLMETKSESRRTRTI